MEQVLYVGIDVAQDWLDVWLHPLGLHKQFLNTVEGTEALHDFLQQHSKVIKNICMEATGGLEYLAASTLQEKGYHVAVVNPNMISAFRMMHGKVTKTDVLDAELIARFAETMQPEMRPVATASEKEMRELTTRRLQLIEMITAERNRMQRIHSESVKSSISQIITLLSDERKQVEQRLKSLIEANEQHSEEYDLLISIPSIGSITAMTLISELPELGTLNKKQIASLAGLAPHNIDSGKSSRHAHTRTSGGRRCVKAVLYMSAVTAIRWNKPIGAFYNRLIANGKPKKVALTACMRKLLIVANQILKTKEPWRDTMPLHP